MLASSPRLVALGASERARETRRALSLKMCMFIQEYSLYRIIVSADLFSHSVSSRHPEQIRIIIEPSNCQFFIFPIFPLKYCKMRSHELEHRRARSCESTRSNALASHCALVFRRRGEKKVYISNKYKKK